MEGVRFTNYYSASPACTASRYALLTGKYPSRAGFRWVLDPKSPRGIHHKEYTLAEYLKDIGYRTAIFGKWHLGSTKAEYLPLANGFDEYFGLPYSNDMIPPKYPDIALLHGYDTVQLNPDQSTLTRLYTEKAIDYIKENKKSSFFIYLPYAMPHTPLFPGKDFEGKSKRGKYGDVVEELDHYIGQLLLFLEKEKLSENTYVIFTSDNGPWILRDEKGGSAGIFRDGKGSTWEGGMREPFIVWGHKDLGKGSVVQETFTALDILPSILGLVHKTDLINPIDGQDLSSLFRNEGTGREEFYYFGLNHDLFAVRKGKWKLHVKTYSQLNIDYFPGTLPLLFNLDEDPSEKYNVASEYATIVEELTQLIQEKKNEIKSTGTFWDQ
jgi:arylsulfatase